MPFHAMACPLQGLRSSLSGTEFAGEAGGVTVKVDGGQRPIALEIADEESSAELAKHIKEALGAVRISG